MESAGVPLNGLYPDPGSHTRSADSTVIVGERSPSISSLDSIVDHMLIGMYDDIFHSPTPTELYLDAPEHNAWACEQVGSSHAIVSDISDEEE